MTNDRSLFAPAPRHKRGLILTLVGSLLFHGSLVGVAAFWPTHPTVEKPIITEVGLEPGVSADPPLPPAATPSAAEPEAPVLKVVEPVEDQPPAVDPSVDEMTLATPTPHLAARTMPSHPASASPAAHSSASRAPGNVSTSGSSGAATGSGSSVGRPGVRWNVPRPIYPPALRLAHVQGSGSVRVTTDGAGWVVSAVIVQSTGSLVLDDQTCQTAKVRWSGPPNATTTVPITYQLQ